MLRYQKQTKINAPVETLFAYHENPNAFRRLTPPWEQVEVLRHEGGIQDGAEVDIKLKIGPVPQKWSLTHQNYEKNVQFEDKQVKGPFAHWVHTHRTIPDGDQNSILDDDIAYKLPLGILGRIFGSAFAHAKNDRMFIYRHEVTSQDVAMHQQYIDRPRLRIAITGASGLIGSQLAPLLTTGGHQVCRLVRSKKEAQAEDAIYWNPATGEIEAEKLEGVDAVIHLAGENIASHRWTAQQKQAIIDSRAKGTKLIVDTISNLKQKPKVLISASGIGYYGGRGDEILTEDSPAGTTNFQSEVCKIWEDATQPAADAGIRVVIMRLGVVLALNGGALQRMLLPFLMGVGGRLSSGKQYMSVIALDDVIDIMHHALMQDDMHGAYNVTMPEPVTNQHFTKILGKVIKRPTIFPIPAFALRLLFGKLADELLLSSFRTVPKRLQESGYDYRYPDLEGALRHVMGRTQ